MKQKLQTLLFALVAIMMPIGVWAEQAQWGTSKEVITGSGTLAEAFAAAAEEGIGYIQLLSDIANDNGYSISGGEFTFDLNGYKLVSSSNPLVIEGECNVTITDGSENKTGMMSFISPDCYAIVLNDEHGVLTINGGKYEVVNTCVVEINEGSLTITGGEFAVTSDAEQIIANNEHGTLSITGGTFDAKHTSYALSSLGTTTVSGGTFKNATEADVHYQSGHLTFDNDPRGVSIEYWAEENNIFLPDGYVFYDANDEAVTDLYTNSVYYIGKTEGAAYTVTFSANYDTEATMDNAIVTSPTGRYTLPECDFNAPEGMMFDGWQVGDDEENLYQPGDVIIITADTEVTAVWGDIKIFINMYDSASDGWHGAYIEVLENGESIGTATLEDGYDDGRATFDYDSNCTYSFIWHYGPGSFYPDEISFEISIGEEQLFTSEEGDCEEYADGEPFFTLEATAIAEAKWGTSADALTSYGTLFEAVDAAGIEDSNIGYIKLLADVEEEIYVNAGTFTLDLNGHTISSELHTLYIQNNSNVTIVDGSETKSGKVISSGEGSLAVCVDDGASVTINGGTYESTLHYALNVQGENSSVTINGGSYESPYLPVFIDKYCSATIVGGTFKYTGANAIENFGNLVVKGGTFTYDGDVDPDSNYPTISYLGGSIDLSDYPTDAINSIDVTNNSGEDITPGAETILLPEGYCFFAYSDDTPVTVLVYGAYYIGEEPAKYTIAFDAGDGEGEMEGETIYEGDYTLPECTFTAPEGMMFKAWQIGDDEENLYQPGEEITVTADIEIKAVWTEFVPQIVIKMSDSGENGWEGASITVKKDGVELDETVTIEDGTEATVTLVYDLDSRYTFYWNMGQDGGNNDGECEFEIIVNGETVYTGLGSDFSDDIEFFFALGDPFVVSFNANDGSGSMDNIDAYESVTLPECTFTAPEGMIFDAWQVGDDEENLYQPGDVITITADTEVTAVWDDIKIVINMYDSGDDGWHEAYIEVLKDGVSIGTATLESGRDGRATFDYDSNCIYSFIWHYGPDYFFPNEISFEISIGEEQLFTSEEGDCEEYTDEQQIYPVPTLDELSIADGSIEEFYYTKTIVGTLTYTRTLPNLVWNALYVPFEIPMSELENYDVAYINDVHSYDNNEDGEIDDLKMEVIKITTGTLKANYPYLIRAKSEEAKEMSIVLTDVTLHTTFSNTVTCSSVFMQFDVTGSYSQMSSEDLNGSLVITADGSWKQLAESSKLNPFRLYLTMTAIDGSPVKVSEQAARSMRIVARGESEGTTSIDNAQWTTEDETVVYDLMGRRVAQPTKGMYIVNGRKVVIK